MSASGSCAGPVPSGGQSRTSTTCSWAGSAISCSEPSAPRRTRSRGALSWCRGLVRRLGSVATVGDVGFVARSDGSLDTAPPSAPPWPRTGRSSPPRAPGRLVELVGHHEVAGVRAGPADVQLTQRVDLVEGHRASRGRARAGRGTGRRRSRVSVQSAVSARKVDTLTRRSRSTSHAACSRTLTRGACRWSSITTGVGRGVMTRCARAANSTGPSPSRPQEAGPRNAPRAPQPAGSGGSPRAIRAARTSGRLLVGAVLQQPGEEQVAGLEQRQVLLVLDVGGRQQPGRLQVEQGRGDHEELGGLAEVPLAALDVEVGQELVGDLGERDLGDVELVLRDEPEQQVERAFETDRWTWNPCPGPPPPGRLSAARRPGRPSRTRGPPRRRRSRRASRRITVTEPQPHTYLRRRAGGRRRTARSPGTELSPGGAAARGCSTRPWRRGRR